MLTEIIVGMCLINNRIGSGNEPLPEQMMTKTQDFSVRRPQSFEYLLQNMLSLVCQVVKQNMHI